jgi:hypothetical protein
MLEVAKLFQPEVVFSLSFFIAFIGFGFFIDKSVWPWLKDYLTEAQRIDAGRQVRYDRMLDVIAEFKTELGAYRETHNIILAYLMADLTENKPDSPSDSAAMRALKQRQTTQDILLRRIEDSSGKDKPK